MSRELPTPSIVIDAQVVRRNLDRLADYARSHRLNLRPHTKTHKSTILAKLQLERGAVGLTVAKVGEAQIMTQTSDDVLMAYPAVDELRCEQIARLARDKSIRVAVDSTFGANALSGAAQAAGSVIGVLVDLDVGHHRTGVQSATEALTLAQHVSRSPRLRLDGIMFFPGHLSHGPPSFLAGALKEINVKLVEVLELWKRHGFEARIVSGGSTPTAYQSHLVTHMTEIRPGTYIFNDMNCVRAGCATLDDCAARIISTVISSAVPGQIVLDAGSKTLTSDRCGPAPESGHGHTIEYPQARITKLSEEHAQVDVSGCDRVPKVGERVTVVPNHICPCVNLQDQVWWQEPGEAPRPLQVEARGKVF